MYVEAMQMVDWSGHSSVSAIVYAPEDAVIRTMAVLLGRRRVPAVWVRRRIAVFSWWKSV